MDAELIYALDKLAIQRLLADYMTGVDRMDKELFMSAFADHAEVDYGGYKGPAAALGDILIAAVEASESCQHILNQSRIDVHKDMAIAESYFEGLFVRSGDEGRTIESIWGRYVDQLRKRNGQWKIVHRVVVHDASEVRPHPGETPNAPSMTQGQRGQEDPVYQVSLPEA